MSKKSSKRRREHRRLKSVNRRLDAQSASFTTSLVGRYVSIHDKRWSMDIYESKDMVVPIFRGDLPPTTNLITRICPHRTKTGQPVKAQSCTNSYTFEVCVVRDDGVKGTFKMSQHETDELLRTGRCFLKNEYRVVLLLTPAGE